jgi:4'-phosphopantetheinyl transferase EntD
MTMASAQNPRLQRMIDAIALPGVAVGHRLIAAGDEFALLPEEAMAFAGSVVKVRRASGAARMVARELLPRFGAPACPVPKSASGAPTWPAGIVGSLAHDAEVALAAMARRGDYAGLGIDIEPAQPLDPDVLDIIATPGERRAIADDPLQARVLFTIKEAIYKAVHPLDGVFLEHHDVEVSLAAGTARIAGGRVVPFRHALDQRIVALAFIAANGARSS